MKDNNKLVERLRKKFEKEFQTPAIDENGKADIFYLHWLEKKIISNSLDD